MNILITGATGLIGKEIGKILAVKGHQLFVVSRDAKKAKEILPYPCEVIEGDLSKSELQDPRLEKIEAVIHLMGEPVVEHRWTPEVKQKIYDSRILGTKHLVSSLSHLNHGMLKVFISGSAIGYYGSRADELCRENDPAGTDFLAQVTMDWENEAAKASARVAMIRTGIVLSSQGGALEKMMFPFKAGLGGIVGDGAQWMSWIHINDIVGLFVHALENDKVVGPVNGVAPAPVTNKDFSVALAESLGKNLALPVPKIALKALYGEGSEAIFGSIRGASDKAEHGGYRFQFSQLKAALDEICAKFKEGEEIFYSEQFLPFPPVQVFDFYKDPYNLEKITPPSLQFNIQSISTAHIEQGTLIDYKLKIHGVPAKWRTLIDEWNPPFKFVDLSLRGPYRQWHHTHEFRDFCGGTLVVDRVKYKLPMGYLGWMVGGSFVRKDIEAIFKYRRGVIAEKYYTHEVRGS